MIVPPRTVCFCGWHWRLEGNGILLAVTFNVRIRLHLSVVIDLRTEYVRGRAVPYLEIDYFGLNKPRMFAEGKN